MTTHLHWLHAHGPKALAGVHRAAALCGQMDLPRETVTSFRDDCTCPRCLEIVANPNPPEAVRVQWNQRTR